MVSSYPTFSDELGTKLFIAKKTKTGETFICFNIWFSIVLIMLLVLQENTILLLHTIPWLTG